MSGVTRRKARRRESNRYLIAAAVVIVLGLIAIYPALRNAQEIMYGVPGL